MRHGDRRAVNARRNASFFQAKIWKPFSSSVMLRGTQSNRLARGSQWTRLPRSTIAAGEKWQTERNSQPSILGVHHGSQYIPVDPCCHWRIDRDRSQCAMEQTGLDFHSNPRPSRLTKGGSTNCSQAPRSRQVRLVVTPRPRLPHTDHETKRALDASHKRQFPCLLLVLAVAGLPTGPLEEA